MTQNTHQKITNELSLPTVLPKSADIAIILGTQYNFPIPFAVKLYREHVVPRIMLTGGINRKSGINEADTHLALLLKQDIPRSAILVENQSRNTLENILYSRDILSQHNLLTKINSIIVIAKWFHAKRALMTFKAHYPAGTKYYLQNYNPLNITSSNWHQTPKNYQRVASNWHRIPKYLAKGDIAEIDFNGEYFY